MNAWEDCPDPELEEEERRITSLTQTITGMCNESTLSRAILIGILETVKWQFLNSWSKCED